jgi:hypothetical protein
MKKTVVIIMCLAVAIACGLSLALFYLVTTVLAERYIGVIGSLIHANKETNLALLTLPLRPVCSEAWAGPFL